ncbi:coiled-coil and C2 domain-containing protein 1-like isoform X2 [Orussus abietinus]|uniref:coiled-coil and C2 domain-containing protein 1-like isoform X2 n=1 Tax=Orussus abietinus TaxID=222816 RepID=UPI0006264A8D|nr:coiled-coil and C2 domain-containing protein 1-like isoform X2 [Orussus abietinus]
MFGKKKEQKRRPRPAGGLAQYGLFEVPDNLDDLTGNVDSGEENDEDLEAELAALTSGNGAARRRKVPPKLVPTANLDAMVSESMKDIGPDEELSGDDDDPALLNELRKITGDDSVTPEEPEQDLPTPAQAEGDNGGDTQEMVKLIQERLNSYKFAEKKAKAENETGRARRFGRGVKTLESLLADAHSGKTVDSGDLPPPLPPSATAVEGQTSESKPEATLPEAPAPIPEDPASEPTVTKPVDEETLNALKQRQQEYKVAAVAWKKFGNLEEAVRLVKIAKQFDIVIAALEAGEAVDLSDMPASPAMPLTTVAPSSSPAPMKEESEVQEASREEPPPTPLQDAGSGDVIGDALKERLEVYRRTKLAAEQEGNSSKVRRYGRICRQFEDALKLHARGKPVPLEDLPTPPGFPPLGVGPQPAPAGAQPAEKVEPSSEPTPPADPTVEVEDESEKDSSPKETKPTPPPRTNQIRRGKQRPTTRADKQAMLLQQRQQELKQAALNAKNDGDLDLARDYLRQAKGIQPLIDASKGGLPVDMSSIPLSPAAKLQLQLQDLESKLQDDFTMVSSDDCTIDEQGTDQQIYENLEAQLIKQIKWCLTTRDHSKALGDVPGYNRWERLALGYTRDLDMLRVRKRDGLPSPQHHYEVKTYAIVQSSTELSDSDVEISIVRGVNYAKEADTYVIFEFPYPSENPPSDRTSTVKGTNNPEYDAVFPLTGILDRTSRQCQRAFKRHALKCQVWAKGCSLNPILCCTHPRGFLRSDNLLGTVTVKLQPLESQCTLHDSFPLMEGRKAVGGKLEVKVRLRNPILTKQIEQITDKWLIIDH